MGNLDNQVQELIKVVAQQKKEISNIERYSPFTHNIFKYDEHSKVISLHTINDTNTLVEILSFLLQKKNMCEESAKLLDIKDYEFKWQNFTFDEWKYDILARKNKIEISIKKATLKKLETRLEELKSPELKNQLELEDIKKTLGI